MQSHFETRFIWKYEDELFLERSKKSFGLSAIVMIILVPARSPVFKTKMWT